MINQEKLALFLMVGQTATKITKNIPEVADSKPLMLSETYDLATVLPESVKSASRAAEAYKLFFIFENYLREFVVETLSKDGTETWWDKIPQDVQQKINELAEVEETKMWMAIGSRDKSALMTYPQILKVMNDCWKNYFEDIIRDRALIQEAGLISHLRNTICHMTPISLEEMGRLKQVIQDWFRIVSP